MTETADLPPSARYVKREIEAADKAELTRSELEARTELPGRTVNFALNRLLAAGLIERRPLMANVSKPCYALPRNTCARGED